ncbi:MAG: FG-GAP repeat protein [Planctomycetes bacterium]|nr:FG-GAP repeat protein [Planctomycetota bacterium]
MGEALGSSLAALAGDTGESLDFNRDGRPDLVIGAPPPVLGLDCVSLEGCPTACASTP